MSTGSSPGTSDSSSVITRAGWRGRGQPAALDRRQVPAHAVHPLMVAPLASSARLSACLCSSVMPGCGSGSSAEPPPEIRHSTISLLAQSLHALQHALGRLQPGGIGTGCAASTISGSARRARRSRSGSRPGRTAARPSGPRPRAPSRPRPCRRRSRPAGRTRARRAWAAAAARRARAGPTRSRRRTSRAAVPRVPSWQ